MGGGGGGGLGSLCFRRSQKMSRPMLSEICPLLYKTVENPGENTMEKRLKVFRAHSRIFLWRSEVIELLKSLRAGIEET